MTAPTPLHEYKPLDPRLVTKTSLGKPRAAIALALILWFVNGKPASVEYGREVGHSYDGGIIDDGVVDAVLSYASAHDIALGDTDIKSCLRDNALIMSQMESLNAAFELVWHLGTFSFADTVGRSNERSGKIRLKKKIRFSSNVDLIDVLFEENPNALARVLMDWLTDGRVSGDERTSRRLARVLELLSAHTLYKTSKGDKGTIYSIRGVYDALLSGNEAVDIADPGEEAQGPTRILKNAIIAGLFPALQIENKNSPVTLNNEINRTDVKAYFDRMRVSAAIYRIKVDYSEREGGSVRMPFNLIIYGAPGTGKSHELNKLAVGSNEEPGHFAKNHITRVTFHPDYSYSQFVGCFKPYSQTGSKEISYEFVEGPFLKTYLEAIAHPYEDYVLLIEELNRANPAAVFGDVFQLLDRDKDGYSVYPIATSKEIADRIYAYFDELEDIDDVRDAVERYYDPDLDFGTFRRMSCESLCLPPNMYIWATMNSADQGVFPMDTAFKRRWDFRYMGINEHEDAVINGSKLSEIEVPCGGRAVKWNDLRVAINNFLLSDGIHVNEDKLLGPFFIAPASLRPDTFPQVFKDKVLSYLYEDAGKTKRTKMFRADLKTYSQVCEAFEIEGVAIFGDGFPDLNYYPEKETSTVVSADDSQG